MTVLYRNWHPGTQPVVLDGAIGTELEKLGATMDDSLWCARAVADHPDLITRIHTSYIESGTDIITTNSFCLTLEAMRRNSLVREFEEWNRRAVGLALDAIKCTSRSEQVAVAGSVSSYGRFSDLGAPEAMDCFHAQAQLLVAEGVDLLILESPGSSLETIHHMIEATRQLRVPVWISLSCVRHPESGQVHLGIHESSLGTGVSEQFCPLVEAVDSLKCSGATALLVMHSTQDIAADAVSILQQGFEGPVGVYPNAGYWERPNWVFVDQISPQHYLAYAKRWIKAGASIIGGCCGIGPDHIKALSSALKPSDL